MLHTTIRYESTNQITKQAIFKQVFQFYNCLFYLLMMSHMWKPSSLQQKLGTDSSPLSLMSSRMQSEEQVIHDVARCRIVCKASPPEEVNLGSNHIVTLTIRVERMTNTYNNNPKVCYDIIIACIFFIKLYEIRHMLSLH